MSNQITQGPNQYGAGLEFDYAVWPANTRIDLVNIPWNNDYRDVVRFTNRTQLDNYIDNLAPAGIVMSQMSYLKPNQPIRVSIPHNRAIRYNYLRANNPIQPIPGEDVQRNYYYFINDIRYIAPNTTELVLQLDVFQTFIYDVQIGRCYVERGHIGIANENQFQNYGRDYLTVPEGLNLGAEYRVLARKNETLMSVTSGSFETETDILVVSTTDLLADPGTVSDPNLNTGPGSNIHSLGTGATFYAFNSPSSLSGWLYAMREHPWITQGIISITAVPKLTRYISGFTYGPTGIPQPINFSPKPLKHKMFVNWRDSAEIVNYIPARYRHLKKFFTAPYMWVELTTWSANPIALRPEAWATPDADVMERPVYMPPTQRVQFIPRHYNSSGQEALAFGGYTNTEITNIINSLPMSPEEKATAIQRMTNIGDDFGDYLDVMTQVSNFPQIPIVNNMAISWMASNQASIGWQRKSADWSQQRALSMAGGQYDIASGAIRTIADMSGIAVNADIASTGIGNRLAAGQAVTSAIGGMASSAAGGGLAFGAPGALAGLASGAINGITSGINTALQIGANDEQLAVRNASAAERVVTEQRQSTLVRDTNKGLADWAAKGDYANTIAGINAKVEDAEMIQPSMSAQFGGDMANIAHGTAELSVRWKLIDNANIRIIGEYWLRYGYAIRAFIQPPQDLRVMTKFTYWKMSETYIRASTIPEGYKQTIRGILEKGVTVFTNPGDIGFIDVADNAPLEGISY